jgi:hypothetical protein
MWPKNTLQKGQTTKLSDKPYELIQIKIPTPLGKSKNHPKGKNIHIM